MQENIPTKKIWFKRKRYGYGWQPASVEGWIVLLLYLCVLFFIFKPISPKENFSVNTLVNFGPKFIIASVVLIFICYKKGEKPKWTWGNY